MRQFLIAGLLWLSFVCPARADTSAVVAADDSWTASERWAWQRIAIGAPADFATACHAGQGMPTPDDPTWADPCRDVRGAVIEQMLTRAPWNGALRHHGLWLQGAHVTGNLDLANAHVAATLGLIQSRIDGDIDLARAHFDNLLAFDGSILLGELNGRGLQSEADVSLSDGRALEQKITGPSGPHLTAQQAVSFHNARIKGSLLLNNAHFERAFEFNGAQIDQEVLTAGSHFHAGLTGGSVTIGLRLAINASKFDGDVVMPNAKIGGLVDGSGSKFAAKLTLVDSHVGGNLFLGETVDNSVTNVHELRLARTQIGGFVDLSGTRVNEIVANGIQVGGDLRFGDDTHAAQIEGAVDLGNAHVVGNVEMGTARFASTLTMLAARVDGDLRLSKAQVGGIFVASDLQVVHDLALDHATFRDQVNLFSARIGNSAHLESATFNDALIASNLRVGADLLASAAFKGPVVISAATIGGTFDLRGAGVTELDLTGASIGGALQVDASTRWSGPARLSLVNATTARLQDGAVDETRACPTEETPPIGNGWPIGRSLELDGFTYGHLGALSGQTGANMRRRAPCWWRWWLSRDVEFSSQPYVQLASVMTSHGDQDSAAEILYYGRVRETRMAWEAGHYLRWSLLVMLNFVAGYGLGTYTFRVVLWIVALTLVGIVLLTISPGGAAHPVLWRLGASLHRVLPGIEINKEFADFFDDPKRTNLRGWQMVIFSGFVIVGWAFGLFLVAAMTGLTQHS